jgi:P-type Ca2+ transporter type 2C
MPDTAGTAGARGDAAKAVQPDGLSTAEAAARLARDGPNLLPGSAPRTLWDMVRGVFTEPMFLMLLVAGGIYLLLGDRAEAALLLAFVFVVIGITLAQERKTQRALESLRDLSAPRALVIRDGQEQRTAGRDVVRGDLLVLHEGDRVAADALLVQGQLTVDESLLTGEAVPVDKLPAPEPDQAVPPTTSDPLTSAALPDAAAGAPATPGGDGTPHLFASTVVTKGVGLARVSATGAATAVGRIGQALAATTEPPSGLQQASRRLIVQLTVAGLLLATAQILLGWLWDGHSLLASVLSGIALAMAILPEEIPVILTVFLALGAWRISQNKVLTRRMSAVEALGAITVLATDKTGTLTQNVMQVAELRAGGASFSPEGATGLPEPFHALAEFAMLATPADPFDPMEKAIQQFGRLWLEGTEHVHADWTPAFAYALSPDILAMTHVFSRQGPNQHLLATKGAPEAVMDLCHLPQNERDAIAAEVLAMAERGLRVLGVARGEWQGSDPAPGQASAKDPANRSAWPASQHDFSFSFLGLVAFMDPPRAEVPAALAECRAAGVRVIMMTGDHPATASAIARQVGLSDRPAVLTGPEIAALGDDALRTRLRQVDLCARLQPEQKLRLVQLLQQDGEVVAMTGDGVNDAPALKAADVGVAMGQRGTDVAREAAALVLLDDSFASIVGAIRQGRRIYDNITHATRFVFAVHMPVILLTLVPALLHWPALLLPVHIVLLELLIDPACSIVFEAERDASDLMTRAPRARDASPFALANLGIGLVQGIGLAAILLLGYGGMTGLVGAPQFWGMDFGQGPGLSEDSARAVVFMALVSGVFLLVLANRSPHRALAGEARQGNPWLVRMAAAVMVLLVAVNLVPWLRNVMRFAVPDATGLAATAVLLTATGVWLWMARRFTIWRRGRAAKTAT